MLTKDQVLQSILNGKASGCLDGRDYRRLAGFFEAEHLQAFGFEMQAGAGWIAKPWTIDAVLEQLKNDVEFGFEKALNKRGISAGMMYDVVRMWMWVLEDDELASPGEDEYAQYGLPLLKAVAIKYGFENHIGDDAGDERKYSADWDGE
jgi:hypothetical protein